MKSQPTTSSSTTLEERRSFIRVDAEFPLRYRTALSQLSRRSVTKNFSQSGLRCAVHEPLPLGARMTVDIALEDRPPPATFAGEVVWCRRLPSESVEAQRGYQAEIGVRFSTDVLLESFVSRLRSQASRSALPLPDLEPASGVTPEARARVRQELERLAQSTFRNEWHDQLTPPQRVQVVNNVVDELLGWGPIETFLRDSSVSEIMVNGPFQIFVERQGRLERVPVTFRDRDHLVSVVERILSTVKRRLSIAEPSLMTALPDGSRLHIAVPPVAPDGPYLTIRKRSHDVLTLDGLVRAGTLTPEAAAVLRACVQGRLNLVISGTASSGKTTMLNALAGEIPGRERIVDIEEFPELQLSGQHVVRFEVKPPSVEGRWGVSMAQLLHQALHMRPDRVIVGELGGAGALEILDAMHAGQEGLLTTFHAHSPSDVLHRLATLALMVNAELSLTALERQIRSSIDLIVQMERFADGRRRVTHISEVRSDGEARTPVDLFALSAGAAEPAATLGSTGVRPAFADRLLARGVAVDPFPRPSPSA